MQLHLADGIRQVEIELPGAIEIRPRAALDRAPEQDPAEAIERAIENPHDYPPLRRALTPDDHVVIVVDDYFAKRPNWWTPVLAHVMSAGVRPDAITVLLPNADGHGAAALAEPYQNVKFATHRPDDRKALSYLAATRAGQRIYLNRLAVDADQLIILARVAYEPDGVSTASEAIFPHLSDAPTIESMTRSRSTGPKATDGRGAAAREVAWLLGAPFVVQAIEGPGDTLADAVAGPVESHGKASERLAARWSIEVEHQADVVIATVTRDPASQTFRDLAKALCHARAVGKPNARIVLVAQGAPAAGPAMTCLREASDLQEGLREIESAVFEDRDEAQWWGRAVAPGSVYLYSGMDLAVAEELSVTPLTQLQQIARLVKPGDSVMVLTDADKCHAVIHTNATKPNRATGQAC